MAASLRLTRRQRGFYLGMHCAQGVAAMDMKNSLAALLLLSATTFACSGSDTAVSETEADVVSAATFTRAFGIVKAIDYLPFEYKEDGCYARALYMAMELAANGIESNSVFAFAQPNHRLRVGDVTWRYHVAPMLEVFAGSSPIHRVIDPSISSAPLTEASWVEKMGFSSETPKEEAPEILFVPGSDYAPKAALTDVAHQNQDTPNFAALPPFNASDLQSACSVAFTYLALEPNRTRAQIDQKRAKLLKRSALFVKALSNAGKFNADIEFSADVCAAVN
jgi:Glutaminase